MQYFIGYSSFSDEAPFDPSLFVDFRKRLGIEQVDKINNLILGLLPQLDINSMHAEKPENQTSDNGKSDFNEDGGNPPKEIITHFGDMISDATACPQDIVYPTDLNLLNDAREKTELLIDVLYDKKLHSKKPIVYDRLFS